jgi:prolyl-tRNA synthetase
MQKNIKITTREENFPKWYLDVIESADLAEHSPVKGCMVIKPNGYAIWENMQKILDKNFKESGVENAYFPLFIPESFLKKEAEHVEGFSPELAIVTHAGGEKLSEPLVVRPTSETIMYATFSKWISSYRDLPLLINQWANVVRWELRPRLFLRTVEFLWQEGHTAHASEKEADDRAREMLEVYKKFSEEYLALPVIVGQKSESEKFAGAKITYTAEAMMQDGKALQMGTSHNLGQNFAKAFDVKFLDEKNQEQFVWQTSWGVSTRLIGALIMAHSDDKGLVLPPKIAPIQVVITCIFKDSDEESRVVKYAKEIENELKNRNISVKIDQRDLRPGEKFFEWEKRGVPVRIEIGPKEVDSHMIVYRRDTSEKESLNIPIETCANKIVKLLENIQTNLFEKALKFRDEKIINVDSLEEFIKEIEKGNFVCAHWSGEKETELKIKEETGATIRCLPFDMKIDTGKCVYSGKPSNGRVIFAKAY